VVTRSTGIGVDGFSAVSFSASSLTRSISAWFVVREVLADQLGADHCTVLLDQAPIGLMGKDELREPGHA